MLAQMLRASLLRDIFDMGSAASAIEGRAGPGDEACAGKNWYLEDEDEGPNDVIEALDQAEEVVCGIERVVNGAMGEIVGMIHDSESDIPKGCKDRLIEVHNKLYRVQRALQALDLEIDYFDVDLLQHAALPPLLQNITP